MRNRLVVNLAGLVVAFIITVTCAGIAAAAPIDSIDARAAKIEATIGVERIAGIDVIDVNAEKVTEIKGEIAATISVNRADVDAIELNIADAGVDAAPVDIDVINIGTAKVASVERCLDLDLPYQNLDAQIDSVITSLVN